MDCNLQKLANFFKLFLCILEKLLKTDHSLFFLGEKPYYFLPDVVRTIFGYNQAIYKPFRHAVLIKLKQNRRDSASLTAILYFTNSKTPHVGVTAWPLNTLISIIRRN